MNLNKQLIHPQSMQVSCSKRLSEISCLSGFYASHRSGLLSFSLSLSRVDVPRGTIPTLPEVQTIVHFLCDIFGETLVV